MSPEEDDDDSFTYGAIKLKKSELRRKKTKSKYAIEEKKPHKVKKEKDESNKK